MKLLAACVMSKLDLDQEDAQVIIYPALLQLLKHAVKNVKTHLQPLLIFRRHMIAKKRTLLWHKLLLMGVSNNMLTALKSLYENVKCNVRINGKQSDWFTLGTSLKQGCILSPLLFNGYINDLVKELNELDCCIKFNETPIISILLYADDIVIMSDCEAKLQAMLKCLNDWCKRWGLVINFEKSEIVHFRLCSKSRSDIQFHCGGDVIETVNQYKYLGVIISEHLDLMSKVVSQSASRALGLLIAKDKAFGGMPFQCFSSLVQLVFNYSSELWGSRSYSWVCSLQNRACRYHLGLGRYGPNQAIMGSKCPEHLQ